MRISTSTIFSIGVLGMQRQQEDLVKTQQQIASMRRVMSPSDDPIASAREIEISQSLSLSKQFGVNADSANSSLSLEDTTLGSVAELITSVRTTAIQALGPLTDQGRAAMAAGLRSTYQQLLGFANSTDGTGQYMFSGYQGATKPFADVSLGNVAYQGDDGQRLIQLSSSRQIAANDSGRDVFLRIKNGNGTLVSAADTANTGSGIIDQATVTNLGDPNLRQPVTIVFNNPPTTFNVTGTGTGNPTNVPFTAGTAISYNGWSTSISGTPQAGDTFTVDPSSNVGLFQMLGDMITLLETPIQSGGASAQAKLTAGLQTAISNFDQALDHVSSVRATVGMRINEIDAIKNTGASLQIQYQQSISALVDTDYTQAVTDLTRQQTALQAAQNSFVKIQSLSIFNYIA